MGKSGAGQLSNYRIKKGQIYFKLNSVVIANNTPRCVLEELEPEDLFRFVMPDVLPRFVTAQRGELLAMTMVLILSNSHF
jgi:hypothetical protein